LILSHQTELLLNSSSSNIIMGRKKTAKKRKIEGETEEKAAADDDDDDEEDGDLFETSDLHESVAVAADAKEHTIDTSNKSSKTISMNIKHVAGEEDKKETKASNYATKTHSAEIFDTDIYVSDGSEDEEDQVEIILLGSRMGIMRRGIHHPSMLVQQNRQWVRPDKSAADSDDPTIPTNDAVAAEILEEQRIADELANLDPAQRAARLLQEKQRKLEEAKELARRLESEENAGRDPSHYSKRTAFDIRFDQLEDKPWERGAGDLTDFFNYGLTEEEWLEYGAVQLAIRQEIQDAHRERRAIDPNIVPVIPKKPSSTNLIPALTSIDAPEGSGDGQELGPLVSMETKQEHSSYVAVACDLSEEEKQKYYNIDVGVHGAWGAGTSSDSKLLQLIEEQERNQHGTLPASSDYGGYGGHSNTQEYAHVAPMEEDYRYDGHQDYYARNDQPWLDDGRALHPAPPPPPPPPPPAAQGFRGRGFSGRQYDPHARGGRGGRFPQQWDGGRGGGDRQYEQRGNWR
jgi:hypothetical protein